MAIALPPAPLRPTGQKGAAGSHAGDASAPGSKGQAAPHEQSQLLLFDEGLKADSFAGLDYIVSSLKADTSLRCVQVPQGNDVNAVGCN